MSKWNQDRAEVERFLNEQDSLRSFRRKDHRMESAWYEAAGTSWAVILCARHHGSPFVSPALAERTIAALAHYRDRGLCRVYAYCLMPDHLHAVIGLVGAGAQPAQALINLRQLMARFKRFTTTQVAWKHGLHGALWQRDFYDHLTRCREDFETQCRYVLENPVRKGLVSEWRDFRWSGIMDSWE